MTEKVQKFAIGQMIEFDPLYGESYLKMNHQYGRVLGAHQYTPGEWTYDLQKYRKDEYGKFVYVGTALHGVKIFMVSEDCLMEVK